MFVYEDTRHAGILHSFRHVNKERRAGLTSCGVYVEFWPHGLEERAPTCVFCIGYMPPPCTCALIGAAPIPDDERIAGHDPQCDAVEGFDAVDERIDDIVRYCIRRGTHNTERDDDGFCHSCGYQLDDFNTQLLIKGLIEGTT